MKIMTRLTLMLVLGLLALTAAQSLKAQEGVANFSLQVVAQNGQGSKPYFVFETAENSIVEGTAVVRNNGTAAGTARIFAVDATTGQTGGASMGMREDARQAVGAWIELDIDTVTLGPGEYQLIPFRVIVPAGARDGDHLGGLVVEAVETELMQASDNGRKEASFQVEVRTRSAVAVQVTIPGAEIEHIDVLGLTPGGHNNYQILYLDLLNSGTKMVKPSGTLLVRNAAGERIQQLCFQIDTFLPDTQIAYPLYVERAALTAGDYTADLALRYGTTGQSHQQRLTFTLTEAQTVQVFAGRESLASPLAATSRALVDGRPAWQIFAMGGMGVLAAGLVVALGILIRQTKQTQQRRRHKTAQPLRSQTQPVQTQRPPVRQRPLPPQQPLRERPSSQQPRPQRAAASPTHFSRR